MEALDCTYEDYQKAAGFSGLNGMAKSQPAVEKFFIIDNGAMRLPTVRRSVLANPSLDLFVANEFKKFSAPGARLFGENTFTVIGAGGKYSIGHLDRVCGPTLQMNVNVMRAKAGAPIVALAHTHPVFRGIDARALNRDSEKFGPADWIPLIALQCPVYLFTPHRKIYVMEYDGNVVTARGNGGTKKWAVFLR